MHALPHAPLQSRPKDIAVQSPITKHHSQATTHGDLTSGISCHNARPLDFPPDLLCLQAHHMHVCKAVSLIIYLCICLYGAYVHVHKGRGKQMCWSTCVCVCVCLRTSCLSVWGRRGKHQISHLIWAASGEVKGTMGRLSSLRRKKETESRWSECEWR